MFFLTERFLSVVWMLSDENPNISMLDLICGRGGASGVSGGSASKSVSGRTSVASGETTEERQDAAPVLYVKLRESALLREAPPSRAESDFFSSATASPPPSSSCDGQKNTLRENCPSGRCRWGVGRSAAECDQNSVAVFPVSSASSSCDLKDNSSRAELSSVSGISGRRRLRRPRACVSLLREGKAGSPLRSEQQVMLSMKEGISFLQGVSPHATDALPCGQSSPRCADIRCATGEQQQQARRFQVEFFPFVKKSVSSSRSQFQSPSRSQFHSSSRSQFQSPSPSSAHSACSPLSLPSLSSSCSASVSSSQQRQQQSPHSEEEASFSLCGSAAVRWRRGVDRREGGGDSNEISKKVHENLNAGPQDTTAPTRRHCTSSLSRNFLVSDLRRHELQEQQSQEAGSDFCKDVGVAENEASSRVHLHQRGLVALWREQQKGCQGWKSHLRNLNDLPCFPPPPVQHIEGEDAEEAAVAAEEAAVATEDAARAAVAVLREIGIFCGGIPTLPLAEEDFLSQRMELERLLSSSRLRKYDQHKQTQPQKQIQTQREKQKEKEKLHLLPALCHSLTSLTALPTDAPQPLNNKLARLSPLLCKDNAPTRWCSKGKDRRTEPTNNSSLCSSCSD